MAGDEDVEYLDVEDLVDLACLLLGDPPPIADIGLLASAASRPQATAFGRDAYPDIWTKAAALLQSVVGNHGLVDGNKRLGWLATAVFLQLNGVEVTKASNDDVYGLVMEVASEKRTVTELADGLRRVASDGRCLNVGGDPRREPRWRFQRRAGAPAGGASPAP